jgi:hypothetical protein
MDIDELIAATLDQQPTRFANAFDGIIRQKIDTRLEDERIAYAQQMFASDELEDEDDNFDDEDIDNFDDEDIDNFDDEDIDNFDDEDIEEDDDEDDFDNLDLDDLEDLGIEEDDDDGEDT